MNNITGSEDGDKRLIALKAKNDALVNMLQEIVNQEFQLIISVAEQISWHKNHPMGYLYNNEAGL